MITAIGCILALEPFAYSRAEEANTQSYHLGAFHPNGVDLAGYGVESKIQTNFYYFYTFGFPSLAATGIAYYQDHEGNGWAANVGVGIGSVLYGAIDYQWRIKEADFVKVGVGLTASIVYSGFYPVLSYEHSFH